MLHRSRQTLFLASICCASYLTAVALLATGCSGDEKSQGECTSYSPPAGYDASQASVTFARDVQPIFVRSCAFESCHGGQPAEADLFLGKDAARVHMNLVGVPSKSLPAMFRVEAGDPKDSLLMRKLDGDACAIAGCTGTCAETMPVASDRLAESERLAIRSWIAKGANND